MILPNYDFAIPYSAVRLAETCAIILGWPFDWPISLLVFLDQDRPSCESLYLSALGHISAFNLLFYLPASSNPHLSP
jgi:hypothetical protein